MPSVDKKLVHQTFLESGLSVKGLQIGLGNQSCRTPYVHLGHTTYPGVEAHLFTVADSALWIPSFTSSGDVVIFRPAKLDEGIDRISLENSRCIILQFAPDGFGKRHTFARMSNLPRQCGERAAEAQ